MMSHPREVLPAGAEAASAQRWTPDGWQSAITDALAQEVPVALVLNGIAHTVMMATPADLEDFALGFAFTEGLIDTPAQLYGTQVQRSPEGIELQMEVAAACAWRLKERRRTLAGRTGCGVCGAESLGQVRRPLPPVPAVQLSASAVVAAQAQLRQMQVLQQSTGATHAAAWLDVQGRIQLLREDVGRHNALDKLVGALLRAGTDPGSGAVLVTSRASFEMVQKTVALGAGLLAAVSAPTALAVQCAQDANLCLAGFVRPGNLVAYTHPERLQEN
jgi:FdhD protein